MGHRPSPDESGDMVSVNAVNCPSVMEIAGRPVCWGDSHGAGRGEMSRKTNPILGGDPGTPPGSAPEAPPTGVPRELWAYCLLGRRVIDRARRDKIGLKKAAREQLRVDPEFKGYSPIFAMLAHNVATRLTAGDWARLGPIRTREGRPLTRTHLQVLTQAHERKHIEALLAGLERDRWTSQEIRDKARTMKVGAAGGEARRGGRPRRPPRFLEDGLERIVRNSADWLEDHGPDAPGRNAWLARPTAGVDAEALLDRLVQAKSLLRRLTRAARELEGRLSVVEAQVRGGGGDGSAP